MDFPKLLNFFVNCISVPERSEGEKRQGRVGGNACQGICDRGKSKREDLQDGSETCHDVWCGDGGTDKKSGGRGGRARDAKILLGGRTGLEISTSESQLRCSSLETRLERQGWELVWVVQRRNRGNMLAAKWRRRRKRNYNVCTYSFS